MPDEAKDVPFESLLGQHMLEGVDQGVGARGEYDEEDPAIVRFVLDGESYEAKEDPNDGYRSGLRHLIRTSEPIVNRFPPCPVVLSHRTKGEYGEDDVLEFRVPESGKLVLELGTANVDDYYPAFVGNYAPENLPANEAP